MAKTPKLSESSEITNLISQYDRDFSNISTERDSWDEKEAILMGVPQDSQTQTTRSNVFDPRLSTIVYERAARVSAQLPTGKIQALTKADTGKNMFMNLIIKNYVYPNAKTQYDLLTKNKLWDVYSNVYGSYAVLVDYMVKDDYIGPDYLLIPMRNVIPQSGKANDFDYVWVRSMVSKKWLLSRDTKNWKNIDKLLERVNKQQADSNYQTFNEQTQSTQLLNDEKDDFQQIELLTRYEADRWITISRDAKLIVRDIKNPQNNNKIPVVFKHCFPLLDRPIGLGEFERGKTLQYAVNSLINLYLDGVKMSIFPPKLIYLPDIVAKTLKNEPAAKWILKNNNMNAIKDYQVSPQGINSFQSTYQFLIGAMLNQAGTTDTTIPAGVDFSQGKTPAAIKQNASRENSRDNWDRFMLEKSLEEVFDRFVDLIANKQEKPIKLNLFEEELKLIQQYNPDLAEMYESGKAGEVTIKPKDINNTKYKYFIDAGTTLKKDDDMQNETLTSILTFALKLPGAVEQAMQTGKVTIGSKSIDVGETFRQWVNTSGVNDPDKIITDVKPEDQQLIGQQPGMPPQGMPQPNQGGLPAQMPQVPNGGMVAPQGVPPQINSEDPRVAQIMQELMGVTNGNNTTGQPGQNI